MDRDTLLNWAGDPVGSAVEWIASNIARVSHHRTSTTVPDLNGMFVAEARSVLTRADLRLKVIEPAGLARVGQVVVRQDPPAGVTLSSPGPGSPSVSSRPAPWTARHMPSGPGHSCSCSAY
jgi:hypothetical protein